MAAAVLRVVFRRLEDFQTRFIAFLGGHGPHAHNGVEPVLSLDVLPSSPQDGEMHNGDNGQSILEQILGDGFVWGVPTFRRTLERRHCRRRATEKLKKPFKHLIMCDACGHFHEARTICGNCYNKVKLETQAIQQSIANEWKFDPVDKEVQIVYDNDRKGDGHFWNGKRIVEMKHERPCWFHKNLQVQTHVPNPMNQKSVMPSTGIIPQTKDDGTNKM